MKRFITIFCLFFILVVFAQAQTEYVPFSREHQQQLMHSSSRYVISLAGEWERKTSNSPWHKAYLPYSEMGSGTFEYRRSFKIDASLLKKHTWHLYCLGINYRVEMRVNGQYLGSHVGGTTPFMLKIPDQVLTNDVNTVEFTVSNELNAHSTTPLRREIFGAKTYGGVTREILLVGTPQVWVSDFNIKTTFSNNYANCSIQAPVVIASGALERLTADSSVSVKTNAIGKAMITVEAELRDPQNGNAVVARAQTLTTEIESNRNTPLTLKMDCSSPKLWSPAQPQLYTMVISVKRGAQTIEDYSVSVGLREVKIGSADGKASVLLNGKPFEFKGVDYIEDKENRGMTLSARDFENDVLSMKTLGANIVRIRHSTPNPYFVSLCNKYGLFVLPELPVSQTPEGILGSENFIATAQNIMRDMTTQFDWHPSVLGWGISDEAREGTPAVELYAKRLLETIRANSSKLVYKTVRSGAKNVVASGVDFLVFHVVESDIARFRSESERLRSLVSSVPSVFSYGIAIQPSNHNGYSDIMSVEAQTKYLRDRFRIIQEAKIGDGSIIWSFNDYAVDRPILTTNNPQQFIAYAGLTAQNRDVRLAYEMMKALFNDEKEPTVTAGTFQESSPFLFTIISVVCLILFLVLINSSRRFRENVVRALLRPYNFYADIRDQRILSNARTVILAVIISATLGMMISSLLYYLRQSYQLDYLLTYIVPSDSAKALVNTLIWMPSGLTAAIALAFFLLSIMISGIIRFGSIFVRSRIFFSDAFVISVWAALPVVFLLVLTMGMYKVLESGAFTEVFFTLIFVVVIWFLYRVLRGTAVIYDVWSPKIYGIGIGLLLIVFGVIALLYNNNYSFFGYLYHFFKTIYL